MSVTIAKNRITMTRGDSLCVPVSVVIDGAEYAPQAGDAVRFALKRSALNGAGTEYADREPLIRKAIPVETMLLELTPGDTKNLGFGRYDYDVEITLAGGQTLTFISSTLTLLKEVH